jgi:HSP20 family molecular chaperone IbpA
MYLGMYGPTLDNATDKDVKRLAELLQLKSEDVLAFDAQKFIELSDKLLQLQVVTEKQVKQDAVVSSAAPALAQQFPPVNTLRGAKQFAVLAEIAGKEGEDFQLCVNKRKRTWTIKGERRLKLPRLFYEQSDVHEGAEVSHYDALHNSNAGLAHDPHSGLLLVESGLSVDSEENKTWLKEEIFQGAFERNGEFPPEVDLSVTASKSNQDGIQVWSWPVVTEEEIAQ